MLKLCMKTKDLFLITQFTQLSNSLKKGIQRCFFTKKKKKKVECLLGKMFEYNEFIFSLTALYPSHSSDSSQQWDSNQFA